MAEWIVADVWFLHPGGAVEMGGVRYRAYLQYRWKYAERWAGIEWELTVSPHVEGEAVADRVLDEVPVRLFGHQDGPERRAFFRSIGEFRVTSEKSPKRPDDYQLTTEPPPPRVRGPDRR